MAAGEISSQDNNGRRERTRAGLTTNRHRCMLIMKLEGTDEQSDGKRHSVAGFLNCEGLRSITSGWNVSFSFASFLAFSAKAERGPTTV